MNSNGNHLYFPQKVRGDLLPTIAALHNIIKKQGYSDIILDFSKTDFLSPGFMLPLVTTCRNYRRDNVNFEIILPLDRRAAGMLRNANWLHTIIPELYPKSEKIYKTQVPARQFLTPDDHFSGVDETINVILNTIPDLKRPNLKALEWALNEITDNVLNHAESPVGGIMQVTTLPKRRRIEFMVSDAGIGIPASLRGSRTDILDDASALRAAINEGVTRNSKTNQGNGLYGTYKCCTVSGGEFEILSKNVRLLYTRNSLRVTSSAIPYGGTFVRASIAYDYDRLLEEALVFKGKSHDPEFDFVERRYVSDENNIIFVVKKEINNFGSRDSGRLAMVKISNITEKFKIPIVFDFNGVRVISSSFADEVFGKIFLELGSINFGQLCKFTNIDDTIKGLIDRAIGQRMKLISGNN
jgi:hypothetical protein